VQELDSSGENMGELKIDIGAHGTLDDDELEEWTLRLRRELDDLEIGTVELRRDNAPSGAKGGDAVELGTLLVTLANSSVLAAVVGLVRTWTDRDPRRTARVRYGDKEIDLTGLSAEDQRRLIEDWRGAHDDE
jgi:hypothetical protein